MSHTFTITLPDADYKAMELMLSDPDDWVAKAVRNKARKCLIRLAEYVGQDPQGSFSAEGLAEIEKDITDAGMLMQQPKHYPKPIRRKMALLTTIPLRADRDQAEMDKMGL
jgi:hypothetical protein